MATIKLQKFLAHAGIASRRAAEELIAEAKVKINGQVATIGQRVDPDVDLVMVNDQAVSALEKLLYFLIYKQVGTVSTVDDDLGRPTILQMLPKDITNQARLFPVGRLDLESEGLMLLTNDGELTYKLTHPKFGMPKTYHVLIDREPTYLALEHLESGVKLKEGMTAPCEVELLDKSGEQRWIKITIYEGRNRQVRRMLERVGYDTLRLIRIKMGPFTLEHLQNKDFCELSETQVQQIISAYEQKHQADLVRS
jgi:pseudouridine synthase